MAYLPDVLYRAEQVRQLDQMAIQSFAIPGYTLMQRAGQAAFDVIREHWPAAERILVACGGGNNGGDGYVIAWLAKQAGLDVSLLQVTRAEHISGDADLARQDWLAAGGSEISWQDAEHFSVLLDNNDLLVDALLGTGLLRDVSGDWKTLIDLLNPHRIPVLAVDIPSGLNADSGVVMGSGVRADRTISYVGLKQGMFTAAGVEFCGQILFDDLQIPAEVYDTVKPAATRLDANNACRLVPAARRASDHKGKFGHVLVVGGGPGMPGAALMAALAAARSGAGLVSIATHPDHAVQLVSRCPELMCHGVQSATELGKLLERATVVVLGPGLGRSAWASDLFARVLDTDLPLVVDADGLNLLAREKATRDNWVLTPHPGEAARLLASSTAEVQHDRFAAARQIASDYQAVCVLKGSGSLIHDLDDRVAISTSGNPGMATGGMGDILGGIIAALTAQGLDLANAARLGVWLHGRAADMEAAAGGERGMLATDLLPWIRSLINDCGLQTESEVDSDGDLPV